MAESDIPLCDRPECKAKLSLRPGAVNRCTAKDCGLPERLFWPEDRHWLDYSRLHSVDG